MYPTLTTPAVIVDMDIVDSNIDKLAERLRSHKITHRPHIKTHKSVTFARRQLQAGAVGITVAKLSEAEVFVEAGITDILVAFSLVGEDKLRRFGALHRKADLQTTVDSFVVASGLSQVGLHTGKPVEVLIEVDGGMHRGGLQPGEPVLEFARSIQYLPGIHVSGIMGYFGGIYDEPSREGVMDAAKREAETLQNTAMLLEGAGISCTIISAGSTPASYVPEQLAGIDEVRAGNYIFNDVSAMELGLANVEDCALRVVATVISTPLPGCATIDAGTKTLTSDRAHHRPGYGHVVGRPGVSIAALNEEHGHLRFDPSQEGFQVGDRIEVIPNHACVIPNLNNHVYGVRKGAVVEEIRIDARGCNY